MTKTTLKTYFNIGDIPTEAQFAELIDAIPGKAGVVVAASDAPGDWKAQADYVCDGISDQTEIVQALAKLGTAATPGGEVRLSPGNFYLTSELTFNSYQAVALLGQGARATYLNFTLSSGSACIYVSPSASTRQMRFAGFDIHGDGVNTLYGIYCGANIAYSHFFDIVIEHATDTSFYCAAGGVSQIMIEYVRALNPVNYGFYGNLTACSLINCFAMGGMTATGFCIFGIGNVLIECIADHMKLGFDVPPPGQAITIVEPYTEGCHQGMRLGGGWLSNAINVQGGLIAMRAGATGTASVEILRSDTVTITGLGVDTQIDLTSFYVHSGTSNCQINNCWPGYVAGGTPTVPYTIEPYAKVRVMDEVYHPTNNKGFTSVADGGTISHGLLLTPTVVTVTPSIANEMASVTAKSATTFTVALKKYDGTTGTTQSVYWRAEV